MLTRGIARKMIVDILNLRDAAIRDNMQFFDYKFDTKKNATQIQPFTRMVSEASNETIVFYAVRCDSLRFRLK